MSGQSYQDRFWVQGGTQVKPDFAETPTPKAPGRTATPSKELIIISDSDDEVQRSASSKRPSKRPRIENESTPRPKTDDRARVRRRAEEELARILGGKEYVDEFIQQSRDARERQKREVSERQEALEKENKKANELFQQSRDAQKRLKREANERQKELEKIIKELQEENSRKNALIMTSPDKGELDKVNTEKATLQLELGRTQSALTNAVSEKIESLLKSETLETETGQIRLKNSGLQRELEGANEKIAELEEHIAKLEEHTSSCIVGQQPPGFFDKSREVCKRIMDNYAKLAVERGWEKDT